MVFGHPLSWYVQYIRLPLLIVATILILLEIISRIAQLTGLSLALGTPLSWLVKLGAAYAVGAGIGRAERRIYQSLVGGGLLGIGIGIISVAISVFRKITYVQPELFGIFGGLDIFFIIGSEMIITSFVAVVGGVLAGAQLEEV